MATSISSSNGTFLRFETKEEAQEYERAELLLMLKFYAKQREKYGVWASNQSRYLKEGEVFNPFDNALMEQLYQLHKDEL